MPAQWKKSWYAATSIGLMRGNDAKGMLNEWGTLTRAEAITIIERVLALKEGKTLAIDKMAVAQAEVFYHGTNLFTMLPEIFNPADIDAFDLTTISQRGGKNNAYTAFNHRVLVVDLDNPNDPNRHYLGKARYNSNDWNNHRTVPASNAIALVRVRDTDVGTNPEGYASSAGHSGWVGVGFSYENSHNSHRPRNAVGTEIYEQRIQLPNTRYTSWQIAYFTKEQMAKVSSVDVELYEILEVMQPEQWRNLYSRMID